MIEGVYLFNYPAASGYIIALYDGDSVYIPLSNFLSRLKIYYDYIPERKLFKGFLIHPDSTFEINFSTNTAKFKSRTYPLNRNHWVASELEYYVQPALLSEIFPFKFIVDQGELVILLRSNYTLPCLEEYYRKKRYAAKVPTEEEEFFAPMRYDRQRKWLNGGLFSYSLFGANNYNRQLNLNERNYTFTGALGLEALGGDVELRSFNSYFESQNKLNTNLNFFWRYYFLNNPYLTFVKLGNLSTYTNRSTSLPVNAFDGIQVSNELVQMPNLFKHFEIEDKTNPNWQVEVYVDNVLFQQVTTDSTGIYKFKIPVKYGGTSVTYKFYGTRGEIDEKSEYIQAPIYFLRENDFRYLLSAGRRTADRINMLDFRIAYGVTDWITLEASGEKFEGTAKPNFYGTLSARLMPELITRMNYFTDKLYGLDFTYADRTLGNLYGGFTNYLGRSVFNPSGDKYAFSASIGFPGLFSNTTYLNFNGRRIVGEDRNSTFLNARLMFRLRNFFFNANYSSNFTTYTDERRNPVSFQNIFFAANYNIMSRSRSRIYNSTQIRFNTSYNINNKKFGNLVLSINQLMFKFFRMSFSVTASPDFKNLSYGLGLSLSLKEIKTGTSFRASNNGDYYISQSAEGIVNYDSYDNNWFFTSEQTGVGSGGTGVRFFIDENDNDIFDENEINVTNYGIQMPFGNTVHDIDNKVYYTFGLPMYYRVNMKVLSETFENPTVFPKFSEFSFIVDPNVYKPLNIPCYVAGILEGNVYRMVGNTKKTQKGLNLHLFNSDSSYFVTIPVLTDGSFYQMGVPPGNYKLTVDPKQLEILGLQQSPETLEITVKKTLDGDFIDNLNIELVRATSKPVDKETPKEETIETPKVEEEVITPETPKDTTIVKEPPKVKIEPNETVIFNYASSTATAIPTEMYPYLDALVDYFMKKPGVRISVAGHTETMPTIQQARDISERRAQEISRYLESKGIPSRSIYARGLGALYPLESNLTPEGQAKNRRVEIMVIE
ncbi:MAG: OmpA family protein [Candidatus Kapabacteria bacterium]|nr:OmpA family protein [Candidatus Kapabacteria bacterium]